MKRSGAQGRRSAPKRRRTVGYSDSDEDEVSEASSVELVVRNVVEEGKQLWKKYKNSDIDVQEQWWIDRSILSARIHQNFFMDEYLNRGKRLVTKLMVFETVDLHHMFLRNIQQLIAVMDGAYFNTVSLEGASFDFAEYSTDINCRSDVIRMVRRDFPTSETQVAFIFVPGLSFDGKSQKWEHDLPRMLSQKSALSTKIVVIYTLCEQDLYKQHFVYGMVTDQQAKKEYNWDFDKAKEQMIELMKKKDRTFDEVLVVPPVFQSQVCEFIRKMIIRSVVSDVPVSFMIHPSVLPPLAMQVWGPFGEVLKQVRALSNRILLAAQKVYSKHTSLHPEVFIVSTLEEADALRAQAGAPIWMELKCDKHDQLCIYVSGQKVMRVLEEPLPFNQEVRDSTTARMMELADEKRVVVSDHHARIFASDASRLAVMCDTAQPEADQVCTTVINSFSRGEMIEYNHRDMAWNNGSGRNTKQVEVSSGSIMSEKFTVQRVLNYIDNKIALEVKTAMEEFRGTGNNGVALLPEREKRASIYARRKQGMIIRYYDQGQRKWRDKAVPKKKQLTVKLIYDTAKKMGLTDDDIQRSFLQHDIQMGKPVPIAILRKIGKE